VRALARLGAVRALLAVAALLCSLACAPASHGEAEAEAVAAAAGGTGPRVLEDFETQKPLSLDGPEWNGAVVRNCKVHGTGTHGILLRNVKDVLIENCEIYDIEGAGIRLSMSGSTEGVTIRGNRIHDVQEDGIRAGQRYAKGIDHKRLRILDNEIRNTGLKDANGKLHGIYVQAQDFQIEGNKVLHVHDGNGISVRSSGVVRGNEVGFTGKSAISYYADHHRGPSNRLLIERNLAYASGYYGKPKERGVIDLLRLKKPDGAVENFEIRFNTAVALGERGYALRIDPAYAAKRFDVEVRNNLLVNAKSAKRVEKGPITRQSDNFETSSLEHFRSAVPPYDFRIEPEHPARPILEAGETPLASGEAKGPPAALE